MRPWAAFLRRCEKCPKHLLERLPGLKQPLEVGPGLRTLGGNTAFFVGELSVQSWEMKTQHNRSPLLNVCR